MVKNYIKQIYKCICKYLALKTISKKGEKIYINAKCIFNKNTVIGNNCHFNGFKVAGSGNVYIGSNFHSGHDVLVLTSNHNYDNGRCIPYDETIINKDVIIEDNCWIGSKVIILPGSIIKEGSVIQAGSVVHGIVPKCSICGGNPAKVIKYRNIKHYEKLLANRCFF